MVESVIEKLETLVVEDKKADVVIVDKEFFDEILTDLKNLGGLEEESTVSMTAEQFADFIDLTVELSEKDACIKKLEEELTRCKDKMHLLELQLKANESVCSV